MSLMLKGNMTHPSALQQQNSHLLCGKLGRILMCAVAEGNMNLKVAMRPIQCA